MDLTEAERILEMVRLDDTAAAKELHPASSDRPELRVAWLIDRNPFLGGEWYRATRPAALAADRFGWHTAVGQQVGQMEGSEKVAILTPGGNVLEPDVLVVRPLGHSTVEGGWSMAELVDHCHAAGQRVVADLDDDLWAHEAWTPDTRPNNDGYEDWCFKVDSWLVSTRPIADRIAERSPHRVPIAVAPNCYDYRGMSSGVQPIPGRRLGTRLWLKHRMSADRALYLDLLRPVLELFDLQFVHIGADVVGAGSDRFTVDTEVGPGLPASRVLEVPSTDMLHMGSALASLCNIGLICLGDHPYNAAKTLTHPFELAAAGLPLVCATDLPLYDDVPGVIHPTREAFVERVAELLDPACWQAASAISRAWAYELAGKSEADYLGALYDTVATLVA